MPHYFAYGANLDRAGMAQRCPGSFALGPAHLPDYRFIVMAAGYATVLPSAGAVVHGLLWEIAPADFAALDSYEELEAGLYRKLVLPVQQGDLRLPATVYLAASTDIGSPCPGYMESVLAAAEACGLPVPYRAELRTWLHAS